ncbi:MAG: patatin-like phospholipase family protein [Actinomycetota bacterium]|nr:patatin-like phospholipase family protein [Actinomycetota bacterium]
MSVKQAAQPRRAIVLGGGGVLGFAWTLGALSAFESVSGADARDVDVILGTSAGSVAASLLGCGLPVEAVVRHHQGVPAPADPPIDYDYELSTGGALPPRPGWRPGSYKLALGGLRHPRRTPRIVALSGLLPSGRGSLAPVRELVATIARGAGFERVWPDAPRPWIVAADYRTGRRVVFGRDTFSAAASGAVADTGTGTRAAPRVIRRASLPDAVTASCSIPAWYPPTVIDGIPYIDGGTISNASVDVLRNTGVEEVYVFAPMASVEVDRARSAIGRVERAVRRTITRTIMTDVTALRAGGARVCLVTPEPADLAAMGVNLMNPARRTEVLEMAQITAAAQITRQLTTRAGWSLPTSTASDLSGAAEDSSA